MPMKLAISAGVLFLLLGTTAPVYAQHEQEGREQGKSQPAHSPAAASAAKPSCSTASTKLRWRLSRRRAA